MKITLKYTPLLLLTTVLALCSLSTPLWASVLETGGKIHISSLHQIDHDLYAFGKTVIVDGTVNGDCIAGAQNININGQVLHSGFFGCNSLHITGNIYGSVRVFANETVIDGDIGRSLVGMGSSITLGRSSTVKHDIQLAGDRIKISGSVGGSSSHIRGETINITGHFSGDLELRGRDINIGPSAVIEGNLTYWTAREDMVVIAEGATIGGESVWHKAEDEEEESDNDLLSATIIAISKGIAAFLFGIIILPLFRPYVVEACCQLRSRFALSFATGILFSVIWVFCLTIFLLVGLLVIVGSFTCSGDDPTVGIMLLLFAGPMLPISAFVSMAGGIAFYTGIIIAGFVIGGLILSEDKSCRSSVSVRGLSVGLLILTPPMILSFTVPAIISLLYMLIMLAGAGAIVLGIRKYRKVFSEVNTGTNAIAVKMVDESDRPDRPNHNQ